MSNTNTGEGKRCDHKTHDAQSDIRHVVQFAFGEAINTTVG